MRKSISISLAAVSLVVAFFGALSVNAHLTGYQKVQAELRRLQNENRSLSDRLALAQNTASENSRTISALEQRLQAQAETAVEEDQAGDPASFSPPVVTQDEAGRKSYYFAELPGPDGQIIGREARFRELLGHTRCTQPWWSLQRCHRRPGNPKGICNIVGNCEVQASQCSMHQHGRRIVGENTESHQEQYRTKDCVRQAKHALAVRV